MITDREARALFRSMDERAQLTVEGEPVLGDRAGTHREIAAMALEQTERENLSIYYEDRIRVHEARKQIEAEAEATKGEIEHG